MIKKEFVIQRSHSINKYWLFLCVPRSRREQHMFQPWNRNNFDGINQINSIQWKSIFSGEKQEQTPSNSFENILQKCCFWSNFDIKMRERENENSMSTTTATVRLPIQSLSHIMINIDIELEQCTLCML